MSLFGSAQQALYEIIKQSDPAAAEEYKSSLGGAPTPAPAPTPKPTPVISAPAVSAPAPAPVAPLALAATAPTGYGGEVGQQIQDLYQQNLGRSAAPEEVDYYYNSIVNDKNTAAGISAAMQSSPEYEQRAATSGFTNPLNNLGAVDNVALANSLGSSQADANAPLRDLYRNVLGRDATPDELASWNFGSVIDAGELDRFLGAARNEAVTTMPTSGAVGKLTQQILSQGTSDKWSGEGFGSSQKNAYDMAVMLAGQGIADIKDFGVRDRVVKTEDQHNEQGSIESYGTTYTVPEYYNKATGQAINPYYDKAQGNTWGGTFAGEGSTAYKVQFQPDGTPIFYTQYGGSSNDLAQIMSDPIIGSIIQGAAHYFGGPIGTAAVNLLAGKDIDDVAKAALTSYVAGQVASGVSTSADVVGAVGQTGANIAGNVASTVVRGGDPVQALITGGIGVATPEIANLIPGYETLTTSQKAFVNNVISSTLRDGDLSPNDLVNAAITAGKTAEKTARQGVGGITNRTYDDTIVQSGADAYIRAKEAGASDEDAMAAADAAIGKTTPEFTPVEDISAGTQVAGPGMGQRGQFAAGTFTKTAAGLFANILMPDGTVASLPVKVGPDGAVTPVNPADAAAAGELRGMRIDPRFLPTEYISPRSKLTPEETKALLGDIEDVTPKSTTPSEPTPETPKSNISDFLSKMNFKGLLAGDAAEIALSGGVVKDIPEIAKALGDAQNFGYLNDIQESLSSATSAEDRQYYKDLAQELVNQRPELADNPLVQDILSSPDVSAYIGDFGTVEISASRLPKIDTTYDPAYPVFNPKDENTWPFVDDFDIENPDTWPRINVPPVTTTESGVTTTTWVDANTGVESSVSIDPSTGTTKKITVDPITQQPVVTITDSKTGEVLETSELPSYPVAPDTPMVPATPVVVPPIVQPPVVTPVVPPVTPPDVTPPVIPPVVAPPPETPVVTPPVVVPPVTPSVVTPPPPPTQPTASPTAQAAGLAAAGAMGLPSTFDMSPESLASRVTQKSIDPLARVKEAQAEFERDAMMNQIDPRLMGVLQQRMGVEQPNQQQQFDNDIGALAKMLRGEAPANEQSYYSYGSEQSIDDILGGKASNYKEGGYVQPLMAAEGGMALPLMSKSGGALSHYGGREDYKDGKHVAGDGDGQSDDIPAWLADGEFVFPADVVSALGNGSTKAGTDKLYEMMHGIRDRARSKGPKDLPPPALKSPLDYLKSSKRSK